MSFLPVATRISTTLGLGKRRRRLNLVAFVYGDDQLVAGRRAPRRHRAGTGPALGWRPRLRGLAVRTAPNRTRGPLTSRCRSAHAPAVERSRPEYYRVLQVDPAANPLVIQAAYRVLAQIWHPDVSGDEEEMKRINAAWEVLGDPRRRKQYDIDRAGRHPGSVAPQSRSAERQATPTPTSAAPPNPSTATTSASSARADDHAGPPPGRPFGPVLRFGRYDAWSIGEIATVDRPFLEWLRSVPAGRGLKEEIDAVLRTRKGPGAVDERRHYETNQHRQPVHTWAPGAPTKIR